MSQKKYCYFQGSVVEESKASLALGGLGTLRGFGVFDFFRMRNGKFCFLQDHLDRFEKSQKFMGLSEMISQDEIRDALDTLKDWNKLPNSGFKLVLLGDGSESDAKLSPLFYILNNDLSSHKAPGYASVILHKYLREYPLIKSTNYFTSNLLHRKRIMAGAVDVLYHSNDVVTEASRSNVFIVKEGQLITPSKNILAGITRKHLLELAPDILPTVEADIQVDDLLTADEVFISSTLKEVCPIVEVDGKSIGSGKVGPVSRRLTTLFQEKLRDLA